MGSRADNALQPGRVPAKALGVATVALLAAGLLFRFALYRHMHIGPGDPHGVADVIEFCLGWALILALAASTVGALALLVAGPRGNRIAGLWLLAVCGVVGALAGPLHDLAARWAI